MLIVSQVHSQPVYKLYAGQGYTSNIWVLDPVSMDTIKFIQGAGGYRMAYCALNNKLYSTGGDAVISIVDVLTDSLTATINPSDGTNNSNELEAIVLSPDQTKLYVADESSDALFVLNTANDSIVNATTLNNADEMENMVISPDGLWLYIVDNSDVLKISTATLTIDTSIAVNGDAHGIEISDNGQTIYSSSSVGVVVIDALTFSITDTISSSGYFLKLNTADTRLMGVEESNYVDVHEFSSGNTTTVSWSSGSAKGIIAHPDDSSYYIATTGGVYKIDAATLSVVDSSVFISTQSIAIIQESTTGIPNTFTDSYQFKVYPNPFNSHITIDINPTDLTALSITDTYGRTILRITPQDMLSSSNILTFDLSALCSGIYLCYTNYKGHTLVRKIIKQ